MKLNIKRALLLPFNGPDWLLRLIILSILSSWLFIFDYNHKSYATLIFTFPFLLLDFGYLIQYCHNEIHNIQISIPSWKLDFLKYFRYGFLYLISYCVYFILIAIIIVPLGSIGDNFEIKFLQSFYTFATTMIAPIIFLLVQCIYSENLKFKDIFKFLMPIKIILNAKSEFLISVIVYFSFKKLGNYISNLTDILYIQTVLVSIFHTLEGLITINLFAQTYKISKQKLDL